jgi:hypothetical protein
MGPWTCALLISIAGALGGVVNAFISNNGFLLPYTKRGILCPGALSNVVVGAFAAFASWSFYGSGAGVELASVAGDRADISLRFSALAGAFLVGVAGAKWITNESDKLLLKESVKIASSTNKHPEESEQLVRGSARFAHARHGLSFEDPRVKSLCSTLQTSVICADACTNEPRLRFMNAALAIVLRIYHRPDWACLERRQSKSWPSDPYQLHPDQTVRDEFGVPHVIVVDAAPRGLLHLAWIAFLRSGIQPHCGRKVTHSPTAQVGRYPAKAQQPISRARPRFP